MHARMFSRRASITASVTLIATLAIITRKHAKLLASSTERDAVGIHYALLVHARHPTSLLRFAVRRAKSSFILPY